MTMFRQFRQAFSILVVVASVLLHEGDGTRAQSAMAADVYVPSRPETITWGAFPIEKPPVATVKSGQTVRIDTLSHAGSTQDEEPVAFLAKYGVGRDEVLQDVLDFWAARPTLRQPGAGGGHVLTGPIYVEGAEPGDTLEIQSLDLQTRVPYGMNSTGPTGGVFRDNYPGAKEGDASLDIPEGTRHLIRTGMAGGRHVAFASESIHVPMNPFMGIMAVAPRNPVMGDVGVRAAGLQGSGPPGDYGGNMDFRALTVGARLFLPVFHQGARFYTGDPHGTQGDGEVSGNALEQSLTGTFRFIVHKGKPLTAPRVENATHYIVMGIDVDLDRSMKLAVAEAVRFLVEEKKMTPAKALSSPGSVIPNKSPIIVHVPAACGGRSAAFCRESHRRSSSTETACRAHCARRRRRGSPPAVEGCSCASPA
jgi:acetamidase/formamidase